MEAELGQDVTGVPLDGALTHHKRVRYLVYDVGGLLTSGENKPGDGGATQEDVLDPTAANPRELYHAATGHGLGPTGKKSSTNGSAACSPRFC